MKFVWIMKFIWFIKFEWITYGLRN